MGKIIFIISFIVISLTNLYAQSRWSFEMQGGQVYNTRVPLTIKQQGYPDINMQAHYFTDAFVLPIYWDLRLARWENGKAWELETIHHKLYLENTSPEVQKFNISHGFNMVFVNRGFERKLFRYRAGAGIVLAHPESTIRGKEFGSTGNDFDLGYSISGPALNLAISKPFRLNNRFFINTEAKATMAYSYIKVAQGHADVYSIAFHLILGLGVDFIKSEKADK